MGEPSQRRHGPASRAWTGFATQYHGEYGTSAYGSIWNLTIPTCHIRVVRPASQCCCGCCKPLVRAVRLICFINILKATYTITQYMVDNVQEEPPDSNVQPFTTRLIWPRIILAATIINAGLDIAANLTGLHACSRRDESLALAFVRLYALGIVLKTVQGILTFFSVDDYCRDAHDAHTCFSERVVNGIFSIVLAIVLHGYWTFIAWSFYKRIHDFDVYELTSQQAVDVVPGHLNVATTTTLPHQEVMQQAIPFFVAVSQEHFAKFSEPVLAVPATFKDSYTQGDVRQAIPLGVVRGTPVQVLEATGVDADLILAPVGDEQPRYTADGSMLVRGLQVAGADRPYSIRRIAEQAFLVADEPPDNGNALNQYQGTVTADQMHSVV